MAKAKIVLMTIILAAIAFPTVPMAQIVLGPPRERIIETPRATRGFSGFVRYGNRSYYCDYVRYPNRTCSVDRRGRERCRVSSWRMVQRCN